MDVALLGYQNGVEQRVDNFGFLGVARPLNKLIRSRAGTEPSRPDQPVLEPLC